MDSYLVLKLFHIISAAVLLGTGSGIAFFMFMAHKSKNVQAIFITAKHVVLADWLFTAPAVVIQIITGIALMKILGFSFESSWFYLVIGLYVFIGICWIPVLRIQYELRKLAELSLGYDTVPEEFKHLMRKWIVLGIFAFVAILVIFWLMVLKPLPVI